MPLIDCYYWLSVNRFGGFPCVTSSGVRIATIVMFGCNRPARRSSRHPRYVRFEGRRDYGDADHPQHKPLSVSTALGAAATANREWVPAYAPGMHDGFFATERELRDPITGAVIGPNGSRQRFLRQHRSTARVSKLTTPRRRVQHWRSRTTMMICSKHTFNTTASPAFASARPAIFGTSSRPL